MVKRIPKKYEKYKDKYSQTKVKDKTKKVYNRKQKKYKVLHDEIITKKSPVKFRVYNKKTKKYETKQTYDIHSKFLDDGNAKKIPVKNVIQNISKKDKNHGVQKKWKLSDGTVKKRYKHLDVYETTKIYERQKKMGWQVNIKIWTKKYKGKTVFIKHMSEPVEYTPITYAKVKKARDRLLAYAEYSALKSDFHIIKIVPYIRYYDYTGGTVK